MKELKLSTSIEEWQGSAEAYVAPSSASFSLPNINHCPNMVVSNFVTPLLNSVGSKKSTLGCYSCLDW